MRNRFCVLTTCNLYLGVEGGAYFCAEPDSFMLRSESLQSVCSVVQTFVTHCEQYTGYQLKVFSFSVKLMTADMTAQCWVCR